MTLDSPNAKVSDQTIKIIFETCKRKITYLNLKETLYPDKHNIRELRNSSNTDPDLSDNFDIELSKLWKLNDILSPKYNC